jgi:hypothetical protein
MKKNNSENKPYYTQRNNKLKPNGACNVTSMVAALSAAGWDVDKLATKEYPQPEDALMHFILADKVVDSYWRKIDPAGRYAPNEWHPVLAYGTNRYMRQCGLLGIEETAVEWREDRKLEVIQETLKNGGAAVLSGIFTAEGKKTIGHVVACVGFRTDDAGKITHFILDDSWGNYHTEYSDHNGNDVEMPLEDFKTMIRHCNMDVKMAHLIRKAGSK